MREWRPWRARKEETGECGTCVHEECAPGCDGSIAAEGSLHALGKGERASSNTTKGKPKAKMCGGGRGLWGLGGNQRKWRHDTRYIVIYRLSEAASAAVTVLSSVQDQAGAGPADLQLSYAEVGMGEDGDTGAGEREKRHAEWEKGKRISSRGSADAVGRGLEGEGAG